MAVSLLTFAAGSRYLQVSRNLPAKRVILPVTVAAAVTLFFSMMWSVTTGHPPWLAGVIVAASLLSVYTGVAFCPRGDSNAADCETSGVLGSGARRLAVDPDLAPNNALECRGDRRMPLADRYAAAGLVHVCTYHFSCPVRPKMVGTAIVK
jgi:hypothetical protein